MMPSMLSTTARRIPSRALCLRATYPAVSQTRLASHNAPQYNEPTGYLFGEKPPPPGQKRKREDWELLWYWGMFGSMAVAAVGLYYKPDTSIQSWALQEAKARMEARGESTEYKPSSSS